jgi:hypothetical protein
MFKNSEIEKSMEIHIGELFDELPQLPQFVPGIRRAAALHP